MKLSEFIEKYGDREVTDELMEMIKHKDEWVPKLKEDYYFITGGGTVRKNTFKCSERDIFKISKRNCYQTEEEVQFALDMYHFCKERSFEPNWEDNCQCKYYLYLDRRDKSADFSYTIGFSRIAPFYYPTVKEVEEIINKYSYDELAKYYGRV